MVHRLRDELAEEEDAEAAPAEALDVVLSGDDRRGRRGRRGRRDGGNGFGE
jgi:hypothetical protein